MTDERNPAVSEHDYIKFLGTAGARFVVAGQLRSSAGTYLSLRGLSLMLDPGPGTLVRCASSRPKIDVSKLDAVILSHSHIDHSNDVNILIDAMTEGGLKKRGRLFVPAEALEGENAIILKYLRDYPRQIIVLDSEREYRLGYLNFTTSPLHDHPVETYGLKFHLPDCTLSFMVDTRFFPELVDFYRGSDILVINVVRYKAHESRDVRHLNVDDAREILIQTRPRRAILTHFGMTMLKARPHLVAEILSRELGLEVMAAYDGMKVELC